MNEDTSSTSSHDPLVDPGPVAPKTNQNKKKIILIVGIALLLIAAALTYLFMSRSNNDAGKENKPAEQAQIKGVWTPAPCVPNNEAMCFPPEFITGPQFLERVAKATPEVQQLPWKCESKDPADSDKLVPPAECKAELQPSGKPYNVTYDISFGTHNATTSGVMDSLTIRAELVSPQSVDANEVKGHLSKLSVAAFKSLWPENQKLQDEYKLAEEITKKCAGGTSYKAAKLSSGYTIYCHGYDQIDVVDPFGGGKEYTGDLFVRMLPSKASDVLEIE